MHAQATEGATTLVWIDSEEAIIVRWADRAAVERVRSEVPGRRRTNGTGPVGTPGRHGEGGADAQERARREELRRFVERGRRPGPAGRRRDGRRTGHPPRPAGAGPAGGGPPPRAAPAGPFGRGGAVDRGGAGRARPRARGRRAPTRERPALAPRTVRAARADAGGDDRPSPTCHFGPRATVETGPSSRHWRCHEWPCPLRWSMPHSGVRRAGLPRSDPSWSRASDARAAACASTSASPARWPSTRRTVNAMGHHPVVLVHPEACTSCAKCARMCPDAALTVFARPREA